MTTTEQTGLGRMAFLGIGVVVSTVANYLVAYAIYDSSYGSAFFLDDDVRSTAVWLPLLAGAVMGCVQALVLGARATLAVAVVTLFLGFMAVHPMVTVALVAAGVALGFGLARALSTFGTR
ncbi:hypothetical protein IDH50_13425 [Aeromicrobium tamlense]|uniref:Uncharacterized protein n=1 Tax=Aeromicrobium tamlense TaxID=375541 RepID=A0A8I0FUA7_9ACTN|nr:hypothetical protein [Aeromicrobium tamlense]MBD1270629.1 hypothetical protein [Aeromicrobium tamlense]MBD1271239.1 hypothetical protein [Aeromicrobium tamlense]NYI38016.1 hypothetical protein [Aeromicrobium tamlense]